VVLLAGLAIAAVGGYGLLRLVRRRHEQAKTRRVQAHREIIWRHAQAAALPTELVTAVILCESGGDPRAVSRKDARGLMQITPIAEREVLERTGLTKGDLFDPNYNVQVGTAYLRMLIDRFEGDVYLALAAYQAGPSRVQKLRSDHPGLPSPRLIDKHAPRSTARYCRTILSGRSPRLEPATAPSRDP